MTGWREGWMDDGGMDGWMMEGWMCGWLMEGWMDRYVGDRMGGWMN